MRLFVAVELPESVRKAAEQTARDLAGRLDSRIRVRWIAPDQMHLTVRFIGHVTDGLVPAVLEALAPPLAVPSFELALATCGVFPGSGPPRVVWIGVSEGLDALRQMHEEFNLRLRPLLDYPEARPYIAHLTLGRVNESTSTGGPAAREIARGISLPPLRCRIDEAVVFQSVLSPTGPTYTALLRSPLCTPNN